MVKTLKQRGRRLQICLLFLRAMCWLQGCELSNASAIEQGILGI